MERYKVSVIVPYYNTPKPYFDVCISTILDQTFNDFEVLIIDDGSESIYRNYLDGIAEKDKKIKVYHTDNRGVSEARNYGIQKAQGQTICFIDSDDYVAPWLLEDLWRAYSGDNIQVVVSRYCMVMDDHYKFIRTEEQSVVDSSKLLETALIGMNCVPNENGYLSAGPYAVLFNSEIAKIIKFPGGIKYMEDVIWNYNYFLNAEKVACLNECVYAYRQNNESVTHSYKMDMINERIKALEIIRDLNQSGHEWYALRVLANYAICCKCCVRTNEIQGFRSRIEAIHKLNRNEIWDAFKIHGIASKWDKKYKIKRLMAISGLLPFVYTLKEF